MMGVKLMVFFIYNGFSHTVPYYPALLRSLADVLDAQISTVIVWAWEEHRKLFSLGINGIAPNAGGKSEQSKFRGLLLTQSHSSNYPRYTVLFISSII